MQIRLKESYSLLLSISRISKNFVIDIRETGEGREEEVE